MPIHAQAGQTPLSSQLVDIPQLISAYYTLQPDVANPGQRVAFGTSGHRGSSLTGSFNERHILATTQALVLYRRMKGIDGPLYLGIDTHALSYPAYVTALEVLAANGVVAMVSAGTPYTPTPAVSHAILTYNLGRTDGLADGIVITPSHNPPQDGGFKYNPPSGGPAGEEITSWVEAKANELLGAGLVGVERIPFARALTADTTHCHDYVSAYVNDLENVIDFAVIRENEPKFGVDPLGGAGVHYWGRIAERYGLSYQIVSEEVDPTFRFMSLDWDGKVRMDPSSPYAMQRLLSLRGQFDLAAACDTDHDRHGIVTRGGGLLPPNHYLAACVHYLFGNRPEWGAQVAVGKTMVSSSAIDRVTAAAGRRLFEVPVGFKFFVDGLVDGSLGFVGEESAGSTFLRRDGRVWTTDKDGIIAALLAAEMTAKTGKDPAEIYESLADVTGSPSYSRTDAPASREQKKVLKSMSPSAVTAKTLAGSPITACLTRAPGNDAALGGLKVVSEAGWFAARPSGTEDVYKIYAESFAGEAHLVAIREEAQQIVGAALGV
jgi:phosphoglucomutase